MIQAFYTQAAERRLFSCAEAQQALQAFHEEFPQHILEPELAERIAETLPTARVLLDVGAGIGTLAYCLHKAGKASDILCVEQDPTYATLLLALMPECLPIQRSLYEFEPGQLQADVVVCHPPEGFVPRGRRPKGRYSGCRLELQWVEQVTALVKGPAQFYFLLSRRNVSFHQLTPEVWEPSPSPFYGKFARETGIELIPTGLVTGTEKELAKVRMPGGG